MIINPKQTDAARHSKIIAAKIESALQLGAEADKFSDNAFAAGDYLRGEFWGKRAIAYYTEAEKLSGVEPESFHSPRKGESWNEWHTRTHTSKALQRKR